MHWRGYSTKPYATAPPIYAGHRPRLGDWCHPVGLNCFFSPRSIAIVGASRRPGSFGHEILRNLARSYKGRIYPVNPKYSEVLGLRSYPSLSSLPEPAELVVVAVRAEASIGVVREAGEAGARCVIVVSGGFAETGPEGARLEEVLVEEARRWGLRLVGPNCIGVYDAVTGVDTFFLPQERMPRPPRGYVSLVSQSGAFLTTLMEWAAGEGLGVYRAINIGNKADVDEADVIEYLAGDEYTRTIGVYIEGVKPGAGRRLLDSIASAREAGKSVVMLKGGKSEAGSRATMSHTASLAGNYRVFKDLSLHAGALVVEDPLQLLDALKALSLLSRQPRSNEVLVVTNAGGPGVIAVDSLETLGLRVPPTPADVQDKLKNILPPIASVKNPIDLTGGASNTDYKNALETALSKFGMALVVAPLQPATVDKELAWIIAKSLHRTKTPGTVVMIGGREAKDASKILESLGIPVYPFPHRAAYALYSVYEANRKKCKWPPKQTPLPKDIVKILDKLPAGKIPEHVAFKIIEKLEIDVARWCVATNKIEAKECFKKLKVKSAVVKVSSSRIIHKTDVGGVILGVSSPEEAGDAYDKIKNTLSEDTVLIQEMVPGMLEVIIGAYKDTAFGPLITIGLGGILVEALKEYIIAPAPLDKCHAFEAIRRLKISNVLLNGIRGIKFNIDNIINIAIKVSILTINPRISEIDLNPVILTDNRIIVADSRIIIK